VRAQPILSIQSLVLLALCACSPVEPPSVEVAPLPDLADARGPYPVAARVRTRRSLAAVELVWHDQAAGGSGAVHVAMVADDQGVWRASIPGVGSGGVIAYHVEALDDENDRGYDPPQSGRSSGCGSEYCFTVR
jgi:hypothetical protein